MKKVYVVDGARTPFLKAKGKPGPFSGGDLFRLAQLCAVSRAIFAFQFPLRRLPLGVFQDVSRFAAFHFHQTHGHDGRLLDDRELLLPNKIGYRSGLIRLDIEKENVGLVVGVDRAELREEDVAGQIDGEKKKSSQA